jgi:hypothetical protein
MRRYIQVDATKVAVGAYVDKKYTASRPAVSNDVVMGKWTKGGCFGLIVTGD